MRLPNVRTSGLAACFSASVPNEISASPACAAAMRNVRSALESVLEPPPVAPVPVCVPVVSLTTIVAVVAVSVETAGGSGAFRQAKAKGTAASANHRYLIGSGVPQKAIQAALSAVSFGSPIGAPVMTEHLLRPEAAPADAARLHRLSAARVNNGTREPLFDQLVADAARLTGAPVAFLGFLDADREWIKASVGWDVVSLPVAYSLTARLQHERVPSVISDMRADPRFASHPMVGGSPFLRFLAAIPLIDEDGFFLGTLSILDRAPRAMTREQSDSLGNLAARAVAEVRLRRQIEQIDRLAASAEDAEERFREFFERTTDLIMSIDADGRLLHANQALFDALAMRREDLVNQPLAQVVETTVRDDFRIAFAEVIAAGEPKPVETIFVTSTGKRINVEGSVNPKVIDGRSVLARVMFRDITERIEFESELGKAKDAALEAARLKTQFLTNVSHEIRTPMNGIVGMIDLLGSTALSEEQRDFAMQARASAEQLLTIINNIL